MIVLPPSRSPIGCFRGVGCGGGNTSVGGLLGGTGVHWQGIYHMDKAGIILCFEYGSGRVFLLARECCLYLLYHTSTITTVPPNPLLSYQNSGTCRIW